MSAAALSQIRRLGQAMRPSQIRNVAHVVRLPRFRFRQSWLRWTAVVAGIAVIAVGIVLAIRYMQTPAVLLDDNAPLSPYDALYRVSGTPPSGPRTGLWIEIPDLHVALPIVEGDGSDNIPKWEALHFPGTAEPGAPGNSYLYAHGIRGMFGELLKAKVGEEVDLRDYTTHTHMTFHISRVVGLIKYNDVSWIYEASSTPLLTLQTCVGADFKSDRWVVQAS